MPSTFRLTAAVIAIALCSLNARAQTAPQARSTAEARASRAYDAAVDAGAAVLQAFLAQFPKGADLHVHLGGAVYAETFIRNAAEDGLCVDAAALKFEKPPCNAPLVAASTLSGVLGSAQQQLYDRLIDSFSMRSFVSTTGISGHDQFFASFDRFAVLGRTHEGEWVDELASRAAAQNEQYLELMETPPFGHAVAISREHALDQDFAAYRQTLLSQGLADEAATDRDTARTAEARRRELELCGTAQAKPACTVTVRYIYQVLRGFSPERVFAQTLLGFETVQAAIAARDDTWVGINFVMPEDGFVSMRDYALHMRMVEYLHAAYPAVHISLHAGELALGLVPPEGLRFHIAEAVHVGHAERIGHGVDVAYEDDVQDLLAGMARNHVMVEINLTSNEGILGIKGAEHPFQLYRTAHVPVALSTDDEGVNRSEITHEYVRAALDYRLKYADLKQLARTGVEHSFLPGPSLWASPDDFRVQVASCRAQALGSAASAPCKSFLEASQKAAAQWELERRFRAFEARF
jgi:adenosine deaminase